MAQFPCSIDHVRYVGRQQTLYIGIVKGVEAVRYRLRLCPLHFAQAQHHLAEFKIDPADGTAPWFGTGAKCVSCLEPMDEWGWQFFGTGYPANEEREDYWGGLHDGHNPPPFLIPRDSDSGGRPPQPREAPGDSPWPGVAPLPVPGPSAASEGPLRAKQGRVANPTSPDKR